MKYQFSVLIIIALIVLLILGVASWGWPVACTARGCTSHKTWSKQIKIDAQFARATKQAIPPREVSLTTIVRRHLVENALPRTPATLADARRYREEILHLKDEAAVQQISGLTLEEYDTFVILPFLQQAALQQQHKAETPEELYIILSREHFVLILSWRLKWDKESGRVVARD